LTLAIDLAGTNSGLAKRWRLPPGNWNTAGLDMLFEVEVLPDGNSPMELNRVFDLLDDPRAVARIFTADLTGEDRWCDVTGWSDQGQCPAYAVRAEDSGEGVILLVYGGNEGIRLKPVGLLDEWALDNASQWGEPCLMLAADAEYEESPQSHRGR